MDTNVILIVILIVAFFIIASITADTPQKKGKRGESSVAGIISREIHRGLYGYVLQNLYIPRDEDGTTEIDVLLVSTKGIFVTEVKNYAGYIFGNDNNKYWTVTLYAGKNWAGGKIVEKHKFYNPIWQNKTHVKYLRRIIPLSVPIYSLIVFSDRGELKNVSYEPSSVRVINSLQLKQYISVIHNDLEDVITPEQVDNIYNKLSSYTQVSEEVQQAHISGINLRKSNTNVCPLCGGNLVIRTARKGSSIGKQFYGCSNYPRCKYTRNIDSNNL